MAALAICARGSPCPKAPSPSGQGAATPPPARIPAHQPWQAPRPCYLPNRAPQTPPHNPTRRNQMKTRFALLLTLALSLPNFALADPAMTADSAKGKILTNPAGMSLYTFAMDKGGMSACSGPCATNWPPLAATASDKASGDWGI